MSRLVCAVASLLCTAAPSCMLAQLQPPLLPPAGLVYRYWPLQLVQFVGQELPYYMIVLDVDNRGKTPLYDVALTDRATGRQTHYVNTPELLAETKARRQETYLVRMQLDGPAAPDKDAQYLLRFTNEREQPVVWQFVELTEMSDQGSGLSPIDVPIPVLLYREQGALAGEGTALKIGSVTSTAEVWKEYAHPPQFVPYRGAVSIGVHILTMTPVTSSWTDAQPAALADGATWKLTSALGSALTAKAETSRGGVQTVSFTDEAHGTEMTVDAKPTGAGWSVSHVRCGPPNAKPEHTLSLAFTPALAPGATSRFDVVAGKKSKVAAGSVETDAGEGGTTTEKWSLTSPDWAKGKVAKTSTTLAH